MKKASKKKATSVASPHEKNLELKSLPARVCRSGLAGTPDGPDDNLVLDGPTSIKPYQVTAQFASEIGERGEILAAQAGIKASSIFRLRAPPIETSTDGITDRFRTSLGRGNRRLQFGGF